ncbi:hypothetical protein ACDQ55_20190 [Chitinophaga sp. 30R24]|uniref:hypothetical protein n=1 Tax=Chitinophaga sp. 30R24 TaxID=3248838 RepID=UPI003B906762
MNYYIIKTEEEPMKIMSVSTADDAAFLRDYEENILCSGSSIQEVLIRYGSLSN